MPPPPPSKKEADVIVVFAEIVRITTTSNLVHFGPQSPQDYGHGFFTPYSKDKWNEWLKGFELQTGTVLKLCTGNNTNKDINSGVLRKGSQFIPFTVSWRQQYTCFRGGKPHYDKSKKESKKPRNAPGSRLTGCTATLNVRLLKLQQGGGGGGSYVCLHIQGFTIKQVQDCANRTWLY